MKKLWLITLCSLSLITASFIGGCNKSNDEGEKTPTSAANSTINNDTTMTNTPSDTSNGAVSSPTDVTTPMGGADTSTDRTVGEKIDDTVITAKVKADLLADPTVTGTDIKVETRNGEVDLSGVVDSQAQIDRAVELARGVEGAVNVVNHLTVKQ
jgi:osmotically-inducible protein OsmY